MGKATGSSLFLAQEGRRLPHQQVALSVGHSGRSALNGWTDAKSSSAVCGSILWGVLDLNGVDGVYWLFGVQVLLSEIPH